MSETGQTTGVDVVVVGAGICGLATAAELAGRGASVMVIEKESRPAQEASGRAMGSLRVQGREAVETPIAQAAMQMWRELEAPDDFELSFAGNTYFATRSDELVLLQNLVDKAHAGGLSGVELLEPDQLRKHLPSATGPFLGAMRSVVDGQCDPERATKHYETLAVRRGAQIRYGTTARSVLVQRDRVVGVETDDGTVATERVLVAAGVWTPHLTRPLGVKVPIMPVALALGETTPVPELFAETLRAYGFSARRRPNGRMIIGAGMNAIVSHRISLYDLYNIGIWARRLKSNRKDVHLGLNGPRILNEIRLRTAADGRLIATKFTHPEADRRLLEQALQMMCGIFPDIAGVRLDRTWTGMVDMSPDGLPIVDANAGPSGLAVVAGLSGHGLTLAPALGRLCAELLVNDTPFLDIKPFRLSRYREEKIALPPKMV